MRIIPTPSNRPGSRRTTKRDTHHGQIFFRSGHGQEAISALKPILRVEPSAEQTAIADVNKTRAQGKSLLRRAYLVFLTLLQQMHFTMAKKNMENGEDKPASPSLSKVAPPGFPNGEDHLNHQYPPALQSLMQALSQVKKGNKLYSLLNLATHEIPDFHKKADLNIYTYLGYSIFASTHLNQKAHQNVLKLAEKHDLLSAPRLIDSIKIDDHYCVVITKIPDLNDTEVLLPYRQVESSMETQDTDANTKFNMAKRKFYQEMVLLAQSGYIHPMMQSKELANYLLVHPQDGRIILDGWDLMMPLSEDLAPDLALQQLQDELSLEASAS